MKKSLLMLSMISTIVLISVGFLGCGDAGGAAKNVSPVAIQIRGFVPTYKPSDVCVGYPCSFRTDTVTIQVDSFLIDPDPDSGAASQYTDVIITGYEVSFFRKDTGTAVPKTFTENVNAYLSVNASVAFEMIVCRADMKNMIPLSYLWSLGYEPDTGLDMIHTTCKVIVWGRTLAGREVVSPPAYLTVDFANYNEDGSL